MSTLVIKRSLGAASLLLCLSSVQGAVVQSNTTYIAGTTTLPVSSTDLINIGQSTLGGFTVSANSSPDETPDQGAIDGTAIGGFDSFTWFSAAGTPDTSLAVNPGVLTFNLDVSVNTLGYNIAQIDSFAGYNFRAQAGQIMTVEYSLVGDAGFNTLGTYSYLDPGSKEYSRISIADDTADYMLTGVDALRFTYADPGNTNHEMVLQEIDVVGAAVVDLVQANATYTDIAQLSVSNTDLVNLGQVTLASFDVSANQGADQTPDNGPIDGTVSTSDWNAFTWFLNSKGQFPATVTLNLDVTASPSGYDISEISSLAGFSGTAAQGKQVVTVEYSVVGDAGFANLGTFTNLTAGVGEYSRIQLANGTGGDLLTGVDALKLTYALPEGTDRMVLQEIDVIGSGEAAPVSLQLASMFSNDMILQREKAVPVWGTSTSGAAIMVEFAGQTKTTTAAEDGTWRVDLDSVAASFASRTLTVSAQVGSDTTQVSCSNVLVGEVWLASGQSNMAWELYRTDNGATVVANATHPAIRLFKVPRVGSATPLGQIDAVWTECNPDTANRSHGTAYYFALKLQAELNVPIGVIQCAWSGSAIEKWQPGSGTYYNGMIAPQIPFAMRGMIWYQGESNVADGMLYVDKQKNLVEGWRAQWGYDFPFYYVQIAPFDWNNANDSLIPYFWEAQSAFLDVVPNTGMAVITDTVANVGNLHPGNKVDPGNRLAFLALDNTYGQDIVSTGPTLQSIAQVGSTVEITFDSAVGLTTSDQLAPDWFEIAEADESYVTATATISGSTVILSAAGIDVPRYIRFAWSEVAQPNLRNGAGLVASAFRANVPPVWRTWLDNYQLNESDLTSDPDADGLNNLLEFALGTDPSASSQGSIVYGSGVTSGLPLAVLETVTDYRAAFGRRKDWDVVGLTYTVQFSSNLTEWVDSSATPTLLESGSGDIDAVYVPYPSQIQTSAGDEKPQFFRLSIRQN